jgi:hypothetical protein
LGIFSDEPRGSILSRAPANPRVLANLYLSAVLPCLTDLADQDPDARHILGDMQASIVLRVRGGPAATLHFAGGGVRWEEGAVRAPAVILLFLSDRHLNAFFSGNQWAVPLPAWGGWRVGALARFSRLAERLEAILDGHATVLATAEGRRLHARLSLIAAGLGLRALAQGDDAARQALSAAPRGLASFSIAGDERAVWFDHGSADYAAGWGVPPRLPDVRIVFADVEVAYGAMRDEIDTMAAVGCGRIKVDGLIPLADGLNFVMERLRIYLS